MDNKDQNQIFSGEEKLLLNHDYDGIQEFDYPLPGWWLATFYGGIIFGIGYFIYYQIMSGPTLRDEYKDALVKQKSLEDSYREKLSNFDQEKFNGMFASDEMKSYGHEIYQANCMSCHNEGGLGDIGPNLVDKYWLYADGSPELVYGFILEGNPEGGMPSWVDKLEEEDLYAVVAYIVSKQGRTGGKAPQGEEFPIWTPDALEME